MKNVSIVVLLLLTFACKDNKKNVLEQEDKTEVVTKSAYSKDKIIVEVTLKTNQDGLFYVNFAHAGPNNKSVVKYQKLTSSNDFQKFRGELDLTKNQVPDRIVLFLGQETPKTIIVKNVLLASEGVEISGSEISDYFIPNSFVEYYKGTDSIKTVKLDNKHIPALTLNTKTIDSLLY